MKKIIFWNKQPCHLTYNFFEELYKSKEIDLLMISENKFSQERINLGCNKRYKRIPQIYLDNKNWKKIIKKCVKNNLNSYHIFSGIKLNHKISYANKLLFKKGNKNCFAITEIPDITKKINKILKPLRDRYKYYTFGRKLKGVFTIGSHAKKYFSYVGYPKHKLHHWIYFSESKIKKITKVKQNKIKFVFVGQIIPRKGIDLLLHAISRLKNQKSSFDFIGNGSYLNHYKALSKKLKINNIVKWKGSVHNSEIINTLQKYDVLILPSISDGWGAVINEAINSGCAIICSDHCGAKDLVFSGELGFVFKSGNIENLTQTINKMFNTKKLNKFQKNALSYRNKINPKKITEYFKKALKGVSNEINFAPWLKND